MSGEHVSVAVLTLTFTSLFSSPQDLTCLFEIYLKPLQKETFLTQDEVTLPETDTSRANANNRPKYQLTLEQLRI